MTMLERRIDTATAFFPGSEIDAPGIGDGLLATRSEAHALAAAGRDAIRGALSGDSEAFLRAVRQFGGE